MVNDGALWQPWAGGDSQTWRLAILISNRKITGGAGGVFREERRAVLYSGVGSPCCVGFLKVG